MIVGESKTRHNEERKVKCMIGHAEEYWIHSWQFESVESFPHAAFPSTFLLSLTICNTVSDNLLKMPWHICSDGVSNEECCDSFFTLCAKTIDKTLNGKNRFLKKMIFLRQNYEAVMWLWMWSKNHFDTWVMTFHTIYRDDILLLSCTNCRYF